MSETLIDVTSSAEKINTSQLVEKPSFVREVFGQFMQPAFWRDLTRLIVSEMVSSFLMALGGTLLYYGKEKKDKRVSEIGNTVNVGSNATQKAFGNGYQPNNTYQPASPSYNMPSTFNQNNSFPGFPTR